jgi:hypothetical protein
MASRDYYNDNNSYNEDNNSSYNRRDEGRNENYGRDEGRNDSYNNESRNESYGRDDRRHGDYNDTRYSGSGQYSGGDDFSSAAQHAQSHSSSDSSLFNSALSFLNDRKGQFQDPSRIEVDEQHAVQAHNAMYNNGGDEQGRSHDSSTVGAGAAMQALKMFTSGGSSDGGMDKNKLIGLAMAQAGKLWEEKEGAGASMVSLY